MFQSGDHHLLLGTIYLLGEVAEQSHDKPSFRSLAVRDLKGDALAQPTDFRKVWTDRGSGAYNDVKIMKMIPPRGYVCLGDVAINSYGGTPDYSLYR